jgi:hypothetical protein
MKVAMDDVIPIRRPEIVGEAGGLVDGCRLTIGIHGEDLDPDEMSRTLGCAPTSQHRKGEPRKFGPPWPKGGWLLSVEGKSPTGPEELVQLLLSRLPTDEALWRVLRSRYGVKLWFGIFTERWNRGFELSADSIRRIGVVGADVGMDIYADLEAGDDG